MNKSEAMIRALLMVDNYLLAPHIDNNDIKLGILARMEDYRYVDDRTARIETERILKSCSSLIDNCNALNDTIFELHQGLPVMQVNLLSQTLCRIVDPDSLLCLHQNLCLPDNEPYDWAAISIRDGHFSNSVLNNGSVDTHIHLSGVLPPLFYWLILMGGEVPVNVVSDFAQKRRAYAQADIWRKTITDALWTRLLLARAVQKETKGKAFPYLPKVDNQQWDCFKLDTPLPSTFAKVRDCIAVFSAKQHQYIPVNERCWPFWDPLRFDCLSSGYCHYAAGERRLLIYLGKYLQKPDADRTIETLLLNYLRAKNAFHQLLIHDHGSEGLMRFMESFARRGFYFGTSHHRKRHRRVLLDLERSRMTAALDSQLRDAFVFEKQQASHLMPIRRLEMRVSLPENRLCLRTIHAWLKGITDHVRPHHLQEPDFLYPSQIGLLFHLIKFQARPYENERVLAENARHSSRKLACILKDYPRLRPLIVGLDVAGDERNSSPRLFCEAYSNMRSAQQRLRPKIEHHPIRLGWTYHVGEDFADLVTALRHIDEVCCLLFEQDGGRLGHALALAEPPQRFYDRRHQLIELSLGAHLLDLVWARGRLIEARETSHESWLESRISTLLNNPEHEPQQISQCYQKMGLTTPLKNKLLESELLNILGFYGDANEIITLEADSLWINMSTRLQQLLRQRLALQRLCIEANPTSNLIIGGFSDYDELPYKHLLEDNLAVSLNTDDPGLFISSLPWEYSAMYRALAKNKSMSHREILNWLNDRLFDAQQSSFLNNHVPISLHSLEGLFSP